MLVANHMYISHRENFIFFRWNKNRIIWENLSVYFLFGSIAMFKVHNKMTYLHISHFLSSYKLHRTKTGCSEKGSSVFVQEGGIALFQMAEKSRQKKE